MAFDSTKIFIIPRLPTFGVAPISNTGAVLVPLYYSGVSLADMAGPYDWAGNPSNYQPVTHYQLSNDNVAWSTLTAVPLTGSPNPNVMYASTSWALTPGDGPKTVYLKYWSNGTAFPTVFVMSLVADTVTLPTGTVAVSAYATTVNIVLSLTSRDVAGSNAAQMRFSPNNVSWSAWETFAATKNWTLPTGDGLKAVYVQFKDINNNISATYQGATTLKTVAPSVFTFKINSGAAATNNSALTLFCIGSTDAVRVETSPNGVSSWQFLTALTNGVPLQTNAFYYNLGSVPDGTYTVYARVLDAAGNYSTVVSQSIVLDTVAPDVSITSANVTPTNTTQAFTFTSTKANCTFQAKIDAAAWASVVSPYTTPALADGSHTFTVSATSPAGNVSTAPASFTWTLDTATGTAVINGVPASTTNIDTATLTISGTGVVAYKYALNGAAYSAEIPIATPITLTALSGAQSLSVLGKTAGGLWQIAPTTAVWGVVTKVFDAALSTSSAFTGALSLATTFDLYQTTSSALDTTIALAVSPFGGEMSVSTVATLAADYTPDSIIAFNAVTAPAPLVADYTINAAAVVGGLFDAALATKSALLLDSPQYDMVATTAHELIADYVQGCVYDALMGTTAVLTADYVAGVIADCQIATTAALSADFIVNSRFDLAAGTVAALLADFISIAEVFQPIVMNVKTLGAAVYTNYGFNSLFKGSDGFYYGCNSSGIFRLTGKNDNGSQIAASVVSGISDFNQRLQKHLPDAYLALRNEGSMELSITTDEATRRTYPISARDGQQGLHTKRCKLARGIKGRNVQIEIRNVAGSSFDLQGVDLITEPTSRT